MEFALDEHPKPKTTIEQLAKLPTVFKKGGVVTAGSASGICDGAAAVILASEDAVTKHGLSPLARIVGYDVAGCEPTIMGIGPVPAIGGMLEKTGVSLSEVDQIEINEAFAAAQALSCQKALDIPMEKLTPVADSKSPGAGPLLPPLAPPHHRPRVLCGRHTHRRPLERQAPTLHPGHGPRRLLQPRCPGPRPLSSVSASSWMRYCIFYC